MKSKNMSDTVEKLQTLEAVSLEEIVPDNKNANKGSERGQKLLRESLTKYGAGRSVLLDKNKRLIAGNKTVEAGRAVGLENLVIVPSDGTKIIAVQRTDLDLDDPKARELALNDNRVAELSLDWDADVLEGLKADGVDVSGLWDEEEWNELIDAAANAAEGLGMSTQEARATLAERFGIAPFTLLDARQGIWQDRKRAWLALGLRSFEGREEGLAFAESAKPPAFYQLKNEMREKLAREPSWDEVNAEAEKRGMMSAAVQGTSIFDPVLCELAYRWFCPDNGRILDPFAGGSVRGLVAARLGREYYGVDLRAEQVSANREGWVRFADELLEEQGAMPKPQWFCANSENLAEMAKEKLMNLYEVDVVIRRKVRIAANSQEIAEAVAVEREDIEERNDICQVTSRCVVNDIADDEMRARVKRQEIDVMSFRDAESIEKKPRGMAAVFGQWPGDESEEELLAALDAVEFGDEN